MRAWTVGAFVVLASVVTASAQDMKGIEKQAASCAKKGDDKSCNKLDDAIGKVKDPALLVKIATTSQFPIARKAAIERIEDQAALIPIIAGERDVDVRRTAIERLLDPKEYARVLEQETEPTLRAQMTARLKAVGTAGSQVPAMEPLIAPVILDGEAAWEAHLVIGWTVFADHAAWYATALSKNPLWWWNSDDAPRTLSLSKHGGEVPAPGSGPFGVISIEYTAKRYTRIDDYPVLLIGDYFDPAKTNNTDGPGHVDPKPVGRPKMVGDHWAFTTTNGGRDAIIFYNKEATSRALWFVPVADMKKEKYSVFLPKYKPIRFTIPAGSPQD